MGQTFGTIGALSTTKLPVEPLITRRVGDVGVSPICMGAMTLTQTAEVDPLKAQQTVQAAIDAGVTLFDTADCYGPTSEMGVNEHALIHALRNIPGALDRVIVATKGGHTRGPNATWWINGRPKYLAQAARESLRRLGFDSLPLYQHHRPDPTVPYEESMGALKELVEQGIAQRVGISNVSVDQLETAHRVLGDALVSVQNEYSPSVLHSAEVLHRCEELGLGFFAWGPLGGMRAAKHMVAGLKTFTDVAKQHEVSPQQVTLAWLLSLSPRMIALTGASRPESIRDSVAATQLTLSAENLSLLSQAAAEQAQHNSYTDR